MILSIRKKNGHYWIIFQTRTYLKKIEESVSGTLIIWECLDRIVGDANEENESVKNAFYQEMITVKEHLGLVFHKFIESKKK